MTYDHNGNLTGDGTNSYTWNSRDQLIGITGPGLTASFQYDADDRRIGKTINGVTTTYLYNGDQAVQEQVTSGPTTNLLTGGLDEVFSRDDGTNSVSPLQDPLGSTIALTDGSGNVQTEYSYEPFGATQQSGTPSSQPSQYTGRENDGTGLYYYRNRYYSPKLQRFISEDPLGVGGGDNQYAYAGNSPTNFNDPLGLAPSGPTDYVSGNIPGKIFSFLFGLDTVADWAWTAGNNCVPTSTRVFAGLKVIGWTAFIIFGGWILKGLGSLGARLLGPLAERLGLRALPSVLGPLGRLFRRACFVAGTPVHTKEGLKPIEEIKVGDEVLSYDPETKRTEYKPVTQTYVRQTTALVAVTVEGEAAPIVATPEHPFYVHRARDGLASDNDEGEWKPAGDLHVGDEVLRPDGVWVQVLALNRREEAATVYNFEVADNHDYFVSREGILVHNQCTALAKRARRAAGGGGDIIRLLPKEGSWLNLPKGVYGEVRFAYHDVFIKGGRVWDPMGGMRGVPFKTWWSMWDEAATSIEPFL